MKNDAGVHSPLTGKATRFHLQTWPASLFLLLLLLPGMAIPAGASGESRPVPEPRIDEAIALMTGFAERTGLDSAQPPRRYLWTDAFAVCNYLGLARSTGDERYTGLALQLVEQVHRTLGRHRDDDRRRGWISGLDEAAGERHPTRGGLRIGKPLPERGPGEPLDERLEWERDGQYFHYLTRWMHALDLVARTTQDARYSARARELAQAGFDGFTHRPADSGGPRRMAWKMSIDLGRILVPSMGQHDPLDGYITALQLRTTADALEGPGAGTELDEAIAGYASMIRHGEWTTADPLGLGGLLVDAWRVHQLTGAGAQADPPLLEHLLAAAATGLSHYARSDELHQPAGYRLAFRELGLATGLHALEHLQRAVEEEPPPAPAGTRIVAGLQELARYLPLRGVIEDFWRNPANRRGATWKDHRDINEVMLATSLAPAGYLGLLPGRDEPPSRD